MMPKNTQIFVSFHPDDETLVQSALLQVKTAGWDNIIIAGKDSGALSASHLIGQSGMVLVFISKAYGVTNLIYFCLRMTQ